MLNKTIIKFLSLHFWTIKLVDLLDNQLKDKLIKVVGR